MTDQLTLFTQQLADISTLVPREFKSDNESKKIVQAVYTRQIVTIVGIKTTTSRFLPVSHEGYSNETYVDKVELLGKTRAEFIARKMKGIERRAHMALFRQLLKDRQNQDWQTFFSAKFDSPCTIPDKLCLACWNCSLFGGMESKVKKAGTFSRIRYFDTFSVEDAAECVQSDDSPEGMAIGNTVGEDLSVERGEASFHRYEYVKAGTRFPFITIIESPTLLDVAGYLAAVKLADQHGYGKYSANHGKFETQFLAISTGYPLFSVLDMLTWLETGELKLDDPKEKLKFETAVNEPVTLFNKEIDEIREQLDEQFQKYLEALNGVPSQTEGEKPKRGRKAK